MTKFQFPIGFHKFHHTKIINYQLNRWYSFGYIRIQDCKEAGSRIKTIEGFKEEMIRQGEKALAENRMINAAFYFRAAEFFVLPADPDKQAIYDRFTSLFYDYAFKEETIDRVNVPYKNVYLPVIRLQPKVINKRGTIVIHGGFDSFKEEFYSWGNFFVQKGYEVIIFEGPGQGEALKKFQLPLTFKWEEPIKAVLDYFELDDVTLLGISMGGWLCFRASAFEPRIKRVIASSVVVDYLQMPPAPIATFAKVLLKYPKTMNYLAELKAKYMSQERWGLYNMMYITKKETPTEAALELLKLNEENLQSEKVLQDVLILTGEEDHFIPLKMHQKQVSALINAKSVTEYIFTRREHAHNHCQVGNMGLALDIMASWIEKKSS